MEGEQIRKEIQVIKIKRNYNTMQNKVKTLYQRLEYEY